MNLKQWIRWEKLRKRGKAFYILINGGLIKGLITALILLAIFELFNPSHEWLIQLCILFPATAFVHIMLAWFVWEHKETRFMSSDPPLPRRIKSRTRHRK